MTTGSAAHITLQLNISVVIAVLSRLLNTKIKHCATTRFHWRFHPV